MKRLFTKKQVINVLKRKKNISQHIDEKTKKKSSAALRKLLSSKLSLYLTRSHSREISKKMLSDHEFDYDCMKKLVKVEIEFQEKNFKENYMIKKRKSIGKFQAKNRSIGQIQKYYLKSIDQKNMNKNNFDRIIDEFIKTFVIKFHIRLNEKALDFTKKTLYDIYFLKIKNYIKYENEIQKINFLKSQEGNYIVIIFFI